MNQNEIIFKGYQVDSIEFNIDRNALLDDKSYHINMNLNTDLRLNAVDNNDFSIKFNFDIPSKESPFNVKIGVEGEGSPVISA